MIIGIDLGTTNSLVSCWKDGGIVLFPNALGGVLTPSAVSIDASGTVLVGQAARDRLSTEPDRSAASFKRAMGTDHVFTLGRQTFRAEELSALVLRSLKADAERELGEAVTEAIITVPAYFSNAQRKATHAAGQLAGLRVLRLLNEPTAAAMAYGLHQVDAEERILVLDLGGGTFDVSILEVFEGVMEVRSTAGDTRLGGDDFTAVLAEIFLADNKAAGLDRHDLGAETRGALRRAAEVGKRALTASHAHRMTLVEGNRELGCEITRERFERRAEALLARMRQPIERAIRDAKLTPAQIGHLVLAGGATRMPMVRRMAVQLFDRQPIALVDPDEVVARGAAVQAGLAANDAALVDRVMTDVAPFTLGIESGRSEGGKVMLGGLFAPIIERNTVIPASRSATFVTVSDYQKMLPVKIFQGEAHLVEDNIYLGRLDVAMPPGKAGAEGADIRFTYDASGLLEVDVTVKSTGLHRSILIENQPGVLDASEIERRLAKLAPLKIHPREQAANTAVLARAQRLYGERLGEVREQIGTSIDGFTMVLDRQDPAEIETHRVAFDQWLDGLDQSVF